MDVEISRYFQDDHRVLETILHGPVGGILMMIATRASAKFIIKSLIHRENTFGFNGGLKRSLLNSRKLPKTPTIHYCRIILRFPLGWI